MIFNRFLLALVLCSASFYCGVIRMAHAQSLGFPIVHEETVDGVAIRVREIARGLAHPWGVAVLPDASGRAFITERSGALRLLDLTTGAISPPIAGVPTIKAQSLSGLFDVVLSPDFARNQTLFISYAEPSRAGLQLAVAALTWRPPTAVSARVIFRAGRPMSNPQHMGGRMAFDREGALYLTVGERLLTQFAAQRVNDHLGKILRIDVHGKALPENPFFNQGRFANDVWSLGHRNPQGLAFHPLTQQLISSEHGPSGGDEINMIVRGKNYGWPRVGHGKNTSGKTDHEAKSLPAMRDPVFVWPQTFAPSGIHVMESPMFPTWKHRLLVAGLAGQAIDLFELDGERAHHRGSMLRKMQLRFRAIARAPDGALIALTDSADGHVLRIEAR